MATRNVGGDTFKVLLEHLDAPNVAYHGNVVDLGDGTYAADYTATKAGEYLAKVTYNGLPVLTCQRAQRAAHHDGESAAMAVNQQGHPAGGATRVTRLGRCLKSRCCTVTCTLQARRQRTERCVQVVDFRRCAARSCSLVNVRATASGMVLIGR